MVDFSLKVLKFLLIVLVVYFGYYLFNIKKLKKYSRNKAPVNIKYLVYKYNLDIVRLGYKRVFKITSLFDSIIVATLFVVTDFIDNIYIRLLVAFILIFPLFAGVYHLIAQYLKKEIE